jgi:peptide/nickel transport system ATP-binding protein
MGLLPTPAVRILTGSIRFAGQNLLRLDRASLRRLRGSAVSMIFQEPMTSLNPLLTIGTQMMETIAAHERIGLRAARERAVDLLDHVGIVAPAQRMAEYPHRLSGGTRQRVMIAMALACGPRLLIADEPTTALDVTIQAQILDLLRRLQEEFHMAVLLITHNLGVVAEFADRLTVMYAGRAMEQGRVTDVFARPAHPYTAGLMLSIPPLERRVAHLAAIPGNISADPPLLGCGFAPRCSHAKPQCTAATPSLRPIMPDRLTACVRYPIIDLASMNCITSGPPTVAARSSRLLTIENLTKTFPVTGQGLIRRTIGMIHAVDGVSINIDQGETVALVGESGCGKTTTAHLVLGLQRPTSGRVLFDGVDLAAVSPADARAARRGMQIVFQDPAGSLDPRMTIGDIIAEPLAIRGWQRDSSQRRVRELLGLVGLSVDGLERYPHEFSGGQRQRIAIARALAPSPRLIVCDEPVSALDMSIQAQIINLLLGLQQEFGLAYLFISHDLGVVRQVADRVAVMYLGRIVETAQADALFRAPSHPYTRALLAAVPSIQRGRIARQGGARGDVPNPLERPKGCGFRSRCPRAAAICAEREPSLDPLGAGSHLVACHFRNEAGG